ncbi:TolC family outer membrane protein [uncultured Legionella sp.]|uniref:TolC family outer membrane protein n=1 Tax=uncultured Legionella sp. TaxID=210934 RepID=UPI00262E2D3B|nr:TolC family outer membrane protein [uncultured Legionella sp.]
MNKQLAFITVLLVSINCNAADLMNVFQNALSNDNVYQEALLNASVYKENVAISRSYLLPNAQLEAQPLLDRQSNSGAMVPQIQPPYNSVRSYDMRLSLSQPIFNVAIFSRYKAAKVNARSAMARLNADLQDLMIRVSEAYFNVLRSEKKVSYFRANKQALAQQLYDVQQKYQTGKTTNSYVYTAKSSYSAAESDLISAEIQLDADKEYLTELTATDYHSLAELNNKIPLLSPQPANADKWVEKAVQGNWNVKANQLKLQAAHEKIKQSYADHLPTVNAKLLYDDHPLHYTQSSLIVTAGSSRFRNSVAMLNVNVPIFSGGLVVATTQKERYHFRIAQQKLEHSLRKVKYHVRDNYRQVVASIKKIQYQQDAILSAQSSLDGLKERYATGSGNLTDVLTEQSKLLEAQMQYESARYDYIMYLLRLKKEAGTLSTQDLLAVNNWLHNMNGKKV